MVAYGGFWLRVVAYFIDAIILNVAIWIIGTVLGFGAGVGLTPAAEIDTMAPGFWTAYFTTLGVSFVISWLYFALMESSSRQATVGKLAVGVVVTDLNGERISFARATGRYFAKILSGIILLIGYIMIAFTERKQGLHDIIAGTLVYKTRDPASVRSGAAVFE
jgi:uncharacterized RDD family membrane protein YckC